METGGSKGISRWHLSRWHLLLLAGAMRAAMIAFGRWQDTHMEVKCTDIDYEVFTDAAKLVAEGQSPFDRSTYRYSPLLAYALLPNVLIFQEWGKILFSLADLYVGYQLGQLVRPRSFAPTAMALWLFNPFTFSIATRGNCESIVCAVLLSIISCISQGQVIAAALLYGFIVHFRIFPIIYCLSLFLSLAPNSTSPHWTLQDDMDPTSTQDRGLQLEDYGGRSWHLDDKVCPVRATEGPAAEADGARGAATAKAEGRRGWTPQLPSEGRRDMMPPGSFLSWISLTGISFGAVSAAVFFAFTFFFYRVYGQQFLHEALLYHASRTDHRHNFSIYFYSIYLGLGAGSSSVLQGLMAFVPQLSTQLCLSIAFARTDLPFCLFVQTLAFVTFNKVITAQYFVWFFSLLPLALPSIQMSKSQAVFCCGLWLFSQLHWLAWAYGLEFEGKNVYFPLWVASILFFAANVFALVQTIRSYVPTSMLQVSQRKKQA